MEMRVEDAIRTMVEAMLPRFSGTLGLEIVLDLAWEDYSQEDGKRMRREVRFLFMRECNYTKVFTQVSDLSVKRTPRSPMEEWTLVGDHDSEWSSGINSTLRNLQREAETLFGDIRPGTHFNFSIFTEPNFKTVAYELIAGQERYGGKYMVAQGPKLNRLEAAQMMKENRR